MSLRERAWLVILTAGVGTYTIRLVFLALANRLTELPPRLVVALRMIPPAALAALVTPALLRPDGPIDLLQPRLWAGIVAAIVAWTTRSVLGTIVVGVAALVALQELGWFAT